MNDSDGTWEFLHCIAAGGERTVMTCNENTCPVHGGSSSGWACLRIREACIITPGCAHPTPTPR